MKYNLLKYYIALFIICVSCGNQNERKAIVSNDLNTKKEYFQKKDLQGIWSESQDENALFFIRGDSLWYVEDQENPIKIEVWNDTLKVLGDPPFYCRIIKLNEDSLCYIDNITNEETKLIRIK